MTGKGENYGANAHFSGPTAGLFQERSMTQMYPIEHPNRNHGALEHPRFGKTITDYHDTEL